MVGRGDSYCVLRIVYCVLCIVDGIRVSLRGACDYFSGGRRSNLLEKIASSLREK